MRRFKYCEPALKWIYYDIDTAPPEVRNSLHKLGLLQNCKAPVLRPQTLLLDKLINSWNGSYFDTLHSNFTISSEAIHRITGLPMDGRLVSSHEVDETRAQQAIIRELSGPGLKLVNGKIPLDKIRKPLNYWVCGLLYSRCCRACRNNNLLEFGLGKVGVEISKGGRINWCQLVADQLTLNLEACRQGTSNAFSFVTILQCWVYDHFPLVQPRWGALPTTNNSPTLFKWRAIDKLDHISNDHRKKLGRRTSDRTCIDFFESRDPLAILKPYGFAENFEMKEMDCKSESDCHSPIELVGNPMGDIGLDCERANAYSTRERTLSGSSTSSETVALSETGTPRCRQPEYRFDHGLTNTYSRSKRKTLESPDENTVETLVSKRSSFCNALGKREIAKQLEKTCSFAGAKRIQEMHTKNPNGSHVLPDSKCENGGAGGKREPANFASSFAIFCDLVILNDFLTGCNYVEYGLSFLGETTKITTVDPERRNVFNRTENAEPEVFQSLHSTQKEAEDCRNFQSSTSDKDKCSEEQTSGEDIFLIQEEMLPESPRQLNLITPKQFEELKEKIGAEEKEIWKAWKDIKLMEVKDICEVVDRIMNKLKENMPS